jgi:hypothetical protein
MKGKRYSTEDMVHILREVDGGKSIVEVCGEKNLSDVTMHRWKKRPGRGIRAVARVSPGDG